MTEEPGVGSSFDKCLSLFVLCRLQLAFLNVCGLLF